MKKMNRVFVSLVLVATAMPMTAAAAIEPAPTSVRAPEGVAIYGVTATCTCSGNGKTVECSGRACTCGYDLAGNPECTSHDLAILQFAERA